MTPRKHIPKLKLEYEDASIEKKGLNISLNHIYGGLKVLGTVLITLGAIYGSAWSLGVAPISNGKVESMITEHLVQYDIKLTANVRQMAQYQNNRVEELNKKTQTLNDQTNRIDERTQGIQEELKSQRDLQNKILLELRKK